MRYGINPLMDGKRGVKMGKKKASSGKDIVLALIMFCTIISGFAFVYAIDYYQDTNGVSEQLFISDTNTEFPSYNVVSAYSTYPTL